MQLFAGIDVGQSTTKVALVDERGTVLARASGGAGDELGLGATSTRLRDAVESTFAAAMRRAGLSASTRIESAVVGISGFEGRVRGRSPRISARHLRYTHDSENALAGAHAGGPGVAAIAGTGSVVVARARDGGEVRVGGYGYLFGDDGSAFGLARDALRAALVAADAGRASGLLDAVERHFGCGAAEIARRFYDGGLARAEIAALAPAILARAQTGDSPARTLVSAHASALAEQMRTAARRARLRAPFVAVLGGFGEDPRFARVLRG
ncbi:MAG: BadF/BadG/BcrA/BcrD ATPase family protein, partial [Candidatus Baltobacteraceae bacterium]